MLDNDVAPHWILLAREIRQFGITYTAEQLADPDWCCKELARLGYAIGIHHITRDYATQIFKCEPPWDGVAKYSYTLWGPRYPKMGDHPSVIADRLDLLMATALYNILRLDWEDQQAKLKIN